MPCRDYQDDFDRANTYDARINQLKERADMLSRIACKALTHIEESGDGLEVLILKDPEIQTWWSAHKEADRKARAAEEREKAAAAEKLRLKKLRETVLSRLSDDEKKALKLK